MGYVISEIRKYGKQMIGVLCAFLGLAYAINIKQHVEKSVFPQPIDRNVYDNLYTYAHLIDISYCISKTTHIKEPFDCNMDCSIAFPKLNLVYQWCSDDSGCGYIANTYSNIFNYKDLRNSSDPKKTIIVSVRGTRSLFDTIIDTKIEMVPYYGGRNFLPYCGPFCKVHSGFFELYRNTLYKIDQYLSTELEGEEDYEVVFMGHSMGGSIALLLALHYYDLGWDKMTVVTMGQPLTGNRQFAKWVDLVMGSANEPVHNSFSRKFLRIVHRNDIVTTVPRSTSTRENYHQFDNQIYLNCSSSTIEPAYQEVVDCYSAENENCILSDFNSVFPFLPADAFYKNHNTYFRRIGLCGISI